jgi:hypothetical protein
MTISSAPSAGAHASLSTLIATPSNTIGAPFSHDSVESRKEMQKLKKENIFLSYRLQLSRDLH